MIVPCIYSLFLQCNKLPKICWVLGTLLGTQAHWVSENIYYLPVSVDQESWCALTWPSASGSLAKLQSVTQGYGQTQAWAGENFFPSHGFWQDSIPRALLDWGLSSSQAPGWRFISVSVQWVSHRREGEGDVSKKESVDKMEVNPLYLNHRSDLPSPLILLVLLSYQFMLECGGIAQGRARITVSHFIYLFFKYIFISWRLIPLQYCSGFCHTL